MQKLSVFLTLIGLLPASVLAQNNYVATSPAVNTPASDNTLVGIGAGNATLTGTSNVFVGRFAGTFNTTGSNNTFVGRAAGFYNTTGERNSFFGVNAGFANTGNDNAFFGLSAGVSNTEGEGNSFFGGWAGATNQTGSRNTFVGYQAGVKTLFSGNTFMGYSAGQANTTGAGNLFLGENAGGNNATGSFNTYLGSQAGTGTGVNGNDNTAIGYESGRQNVGGMTNLFLGFRADAGANGLTNATAIGPNAVVSVSNAVVLGNGANVGIGNSAPTARLHISSGEKDKSGLRLEELNGDDVVSRSADKFLTVDGDGNVILATYANTEREAAVESLWQRNGSFLQSVKGRAVIIGTRVNKTPPGYRLYVQEGILTEKVKVAVKNTAEWSDFVFAPGYRLMPLAEVDKYVKTNRHLPGVPSAETVVSEGVDVAKMNAKLLEKIEELTLYLIEQRSELTAVKEKLAVLEAKTNP